MPLRFNDKEVTYSCRSKSPGDIEGRLLFGPPEGYSEQTRVQGYKERWFKLCGNLMFSFKLNEHGGVNKNAEPNGLLIVENCVVQMEGFEEVLFAFSITFQAGAKPRNRRFLFGCFSHEQALRWVQVLRKASSASLTARAFELERRIKRLGHKPIFEISRVVGSPPLHRAGSMPALSPTQKCAPSPLPPPRASKIQGSPRAPDQQRVKSKFYVAEHASATEKKLPVMSSAPVSRRMLSTSLERLSKPTFKSHVSTPASASMLRRPPSPPQRNRGPRPDRPPPPKPLEAPVTPPAEPVPDLIQF